MRCGKMDRWPGLFRGRTGMPSLADPLAKIVRNSIHPILFDSMVDISPNKFETMRRTKDYRLIDAGGQPVVPFLYTGIYQVYKFVEGVIALKHPLLALVVAIALCFSPFAAVRSADAQEGGVVVTDLGTPITGVVTVMTAAFGVENGRNVMYTVVQADPAIFVTVDMDEDKVSRTLELPDAGGSWSQAVDTFGNVYIGTYAKGLLYRFEPATETLVNLGRIAGEDYVYGLFPGPNGKMYGGTYPNGKTFEYDPATNTVTDFGTMKEGELYVRGTVYDANRNVLYAGTGSHGDLIEYDLATGTKRSVLAEEYREGEPFLYDMNIAGTTLFVRKEKAKTMLAIDTRTNTVLAEVPMISRSPSPKSPVADKVYYTNNLELTEYDLNTNTARGLGLRTQGTGVAYGFAQLKDPEMPG